MLLRPSRQSDDECTPVSLIVAADMPRKIRQLITELVRAGFVNRGGKGSHRNFVHPNGASVTLSGKEGDDAKPYQEKLVGRTLQSIIP